MNTSILFLGNSVHIYAFYPTAVKICEFIVLTHGIWMDILAGCGEKAISLGFGVPAFLMLFS